VRRPDLVRVVVGLKQHRLLRLGVDHRSAAAVPNHRCVLGVKSPLQCRNGLERAGAEDLGQLLRRALCRLVVRLEGVPGFLFDDAPDRAGLNLELLCRRLQEVVQLKTRLRALRGVPRPDLLPKDRVGY